MKLEELGYNQEFEAYRINNNLNSFEVARVISEHKERYTVKTSNGEFDAEIVGNMRYSAQNRTDFPTVGDWVAISEYDIEKVLIHAVFQRKSIIERQAVGKYGEKQIIAANIDYALIVQAADRDFNLNRIERYLSLTLDSGIKPIIILSKIDLLDTNELSKFIENLRERIKNIPIVAVSNISHSGIDDLLKLIRKSKTYCLLGSSGVGKSTLLNNLSEEDIMKTDSISKSTNKGRHITSHRELVVLQNGGILIDNPGMREVGMADNKMGIEATFDSILKLSDKCRFANCSHLHEKGCAVIQAMQNGELDKSVYDNYLKVSKENEYFESTLVEKRKKDKDFGKMIKNFKKTQNLNDL